MEQRHDEGTGASEDFIKDLLLRSRSGDAEAFNALVPLVYQQLHKLASRLLKSEQPNHTLRTTELVHEAYLRMAGSDVAYQDRNHFVNIAARIMRHILVDLARTRQAHKRGGELTRVTLDEGVAVSAENLADLVEIDAALTALSEIDPRKSEAVELVYFGGLSYSQASEVMQVSEATLHRDLRFAKAWLHQKLDSRADERP